MENLASKISIDFRCSVPLGQQLYNELYRMILSRQIAAGDVLPASRELAKALKISRTTVVGTYEQLKQDGYVSGEGRMGTRVCPLSDGEKGRQETPEPKKNPSYAADKLSAFAQALLSQSTYDPNRPEYEINFYSWKLAFDEFPHRLWGRELEKLINSGSQDVFDYCSDPAGLIALRAAIANHVKRSKGIVASADQILIVSGWQQALDLICRIHLKPGDMVAMENPGYPIAWQSVWIQGGQICPINVDADGMVIDQLIKIKPIPKVAHVGVSHQFPTGTVLSGARRLQLLKWASEFDSIIVEDEHDSDFRYRDHPVPALKTLDRTGNVIYHGTFSRSLFPGLGLGYIVLPDRFMDVYKRAKVVTSEHVTVLIQQIVANLIDSGDFERHLKRMRLIYGERRNALLSALNKHFGKRSHVSGDSGGMHVLLRIDSELSTQDIVRAASKVGVGLIDTTKFYFDEPPQREFVVGYAGVPVDQIEEAVRRLAKVI